MCCDLAESVRSQEHWLWYGQKKESISILFWESFNCSLTLEPLVRFRWGFQQNLPPKWALQSNRKLKNVTCSTCFPTSHHILCFWSSCTIAVKLRQMILKYFWHFLYFVDWIMKHIPIIVMYLGWFNMTLLVLVFQSL